MWAGTNAGYVFIYEIHLPSDNRRHTDTVDCVLGEFDKVYYLLCSLSVAVDDISLHCEMQN